MSFRVWLKLRRNSMPLSHNWYRAVVWLLILTLVAFALSCGHAVKLQGAGATFPYPLYLKWLSEYTKLHPDIQIDYQSIGSGGGIKQIQAQTVDFGASDAPMTDAELQASPAQLVHIPTVLGAVVITYHVPGVCQPLRPSPDVV